MRPTRAGRTGLLALTLVACAAGAQAVAPAYTVQILPSGPLAQKPEGAPEAYYAEPLGLNDAGVVVGAVRSPQATPFAALWQEGKLRPVPGVVKANALATAVGARGEVVGMVTDEGVQRAFSLSAGKLTKLVKIPGCDRDWAVAVNTRGDACGMGHDADGQPQAYFWPKATASVDLHALIKKTAPNTAASRALGLNDKGEVVGELEDAEGRGQGFLYSGGKISLLAAPGARESGAAAINASGQIAGWANTGNGARLFLFQAGKSTDLGVLPGYQDMIPTALNARGEMVGYADGPGERGWVFRGGKLHDLTAALPDGTRLTIGIVRGINLRGQIVGSALREQRVEGVLLTPR